MLKSPQMKSTLRPLFWKHFLHPVPERFNTGPWCPVYTQLVITFLFFSTQISVVTLFNNLFTTVVIHSITLWFRVLLSYIATAPPLCLYSQIHIRLIQSWFLYQESGISIWPRVPPDFHYLSFCQVQINQKVLTHTVTVFFRWSSFMWLVLRNAAA